MKDYIKTSRFWAMSLAIILMLTIYLILPATGFRSDIQGTTDALVRNGFKPVHVGGYAWIVGAKEDWYQTNFTAISPIGDIVTGYVTTGIFFKGTTIKILKP